MNIQNNFIYMFLHSDQNKSSITFFWNMMPMRCVGLAKQTYALYLNIFHSKHKISNIANHLVSNQLPSLRLVQRRVDVVDIFVVKWFEPTELMDLFSQEPFLTFWQRNQIQKMEWIRGYLHLAIQSFILTKQHSGFGRQPKL